MGLTTHKLSLLQIGTPAAFSAGRKARMGGNGGKPVPLPPYGPLKLEVEEVAILGNGGLAMLPASQEMEQMSERC